MTDEKRDRLLEQLLDARIMQDVAAGHPDLNEQEERELRPLLDVAGLLWDAAYVPPPLENDAVALMLGLVPDPQLLLEPTALSAARKKSGLNISDLVKKLSSRGWEVRPSEALRWETQGATALSPALIAAVAEELKTPVDRIVSRAKKPNEPSWLAEIVSSSSFTRLAERWAELRGVTAQLAASALESKMLATVHRGGRPEPDQLLLSLDAFVAAMERADREDS